MEKEEQNKELLSMFSEAMDRLKKGNELTGSEGVITPILKRMIELSMLGELEDHVSKNRPNRKNGKGSKRVKTSFGDIDIETPRDRDGSYEPTLLPKRQRSLGVGLERKIIDLYSIGTSYNDISRHIEEMYGMELSTSQLSAITDKVWPDIEAWQQRPLDEVYPFVWLDALFYKVRQDGVVKSMAAYLVLGMNVDGEKDLLGIYLSETESSRFWLSVLSNLKERGLNDILIASIDNLKGFKEAIETVYPHTDVQLCIVHQIRNSIRYVGYDDSKEVIRDMKQIYKADTLEQAEQALIRFEEKWNKKHPAMVKSWKRNWEGLSTFFNYPEEIRNIMYTTNSIEAFNRQIRKATKTKGSVPSERALLKLLYLVTQKVNKRWSKPRSWTKVIAILRITHAERLGID